MAPILHIDFETRSAVDLRTAGLHRYATDPTTDVWCMAYALDDRDVDLFERGGVIGEDIWHYVVDGGLVCAHNVAFELAIWNNVMVPRYGWPVLKPEQCVCTMAMAYSMSLPGSLENAAAAVGIEDRKDQSGRRVMLQLSKPREVKPDGTLVWWDDPKKLDALYSYCKQDVAVERELHRRLRPLSDSERQVWLLDYRINQQGVAVDRDGVAAAIQVVEDEAARLNTAMREVTGGAVSTCSAVGQLGDWIKWQGVKMDGVAKADVVDALAGDTLPERVEKALKLRQEAAKASTAKLKPMVSAAGADGRLRGMFQYHGAATGRWAGRLVQLHNMPRPRAGVKPHHVEAMIELMQAGDIDGLDMLHGPVLASVSDCLRGFLVAAPGFDLIAVDFANIEGRVLAWLAGEQWKVNAFKEFDDGNGPDLYLVAASRIFDCSVDAAKPHRQVGKVAELALGYGGGIGAFQTMAKGYGVVVPDEKADGIKTAWRAAHPKIVDFWYALESAAIAAVLQPGSTQKVGRIAFKVKGSFLWCQLPSGRLLCYPYPRVEIITTPWGADKDALTYKTTPPQDAKKRYKVLPDPSNTNSWVRMSTYGGELAENVTQAVARDLLAEAMLRVDVDHNIVMHVHDEIVTEAPEAAGDFALSLVETEMRQVPAWAAGLPIAVEGWRGKRYRK
jgi:DNA polymerase